MSAPPFAFHYAVAPPVMTVRPHERVRVFTEDAFGGKITATTDKPRDAAPFPVSIRSLGRSRSRACGRVISSPSTLLC